MGSKKNKKNSSGDSNQSANNPPAQSQATSTPPEQNQPAPPPLLKSERVKQGKSQSDKSQRHQNGYRPPKQSYPRPAPIVWRHEAKRLFSNRVVQILLILTLALLPSYYFYQSGKKAEQAANKPTAANLSTTAEVIKRVSRHILLPSGEQPTVATVSDASKVRNQAFFTNAASGDKVLIYAQAKKAYLYRPSIDRMIEVAPLAPNTTAPTP